MNIHYNQYTGFIISWGSHDAIDGEISPYPNTILINIDCDYNSINPKIHKIDLETKTLVEKTYLERLPTIDDVKNAISNELFITDAFVDIPSDRPRKGDLLLDWKPYRQILRDLSKLTTSQEMIEAWPMRPNGDDAILHLREAITALILSQITPGA